MSDKKETTNVQEVDINLNELLGSGVDSVMLPDESNDSDKKKTLFTRGNPDMTFLDKPQVAATDESTTETTEVSDTDSSSAETTDTAETTVIDQGDPLSIPNPDENLESDIDKGGRPTAAISAFKSLFDSKVLLPFDDDKKIEEYTQADIEELIQANIEQERSKLQQELPQQFFGNMPPEMQQAYQYIADGGTDLKSLFQAMSASNEIKEVDVSNEPGQIYTVRSYLQATQYGNAEEIEDEIRSLLDRGDIEKKANQFKPKLDAMSENMVQHKLHQQNVENQQRQQQSQIYMDSVYKALEGGELNGIKLDNRTQNMLYAGLVQPNYSSSQGKQTNMLGHLLEKYQWLEPRHDLIAEALWLLSDETSYREEIRKQGSHEQVNKTARTLKTEQQAGKSGSVQNDTDDDSSRNKRPGIQRKQRNFFERT